MEFIDLKEQQRIIAEVLNARIARVLAHGQYINGPEVTELEERLAAYVGVRHAVGCASGTDALLMALMALGIGPGDAIFTTPFTFIATAEVISLLGATPVFVDIDRATFNLDPSQLERAIAAVQAGDPEIYPLPVGASCGYGHPAALAGMHPEEGHGGCGTFGDRRTDNARAGHNTAELAPHPSGQFPSARNGDPRGKYRLRPRAVIAVDLFGLPADYDAIDAVARRHGLEVIEDAAQSFGGEFRGRKAGSFGRIACTSFFPAKPLGCYGDGGMCFTNDGALDKLLRSIRVHGQGSDKYNNDRIGINGRLDTLQAAILLAKFTLFPGEVERRQRVAGRYGRLLAGIVETPVIPDGYQSAWAQYSILAADPAAREALMARLREGGVPTAIYYPKPLHLQAAFAGLGYRSEAASDVALLPGAAVRAGRKDAAPPAEQPVGGIAVRQRGEKQRNGSPAAGQPDPGSGALFPVSEECARRIFSLPMHPYLEEAAQQRIAALLGGGAALMAGPGPGG